MEINVSKLVLAEAFCISRLQTQLQTYTLAQELQKYCNKLVPR